MNICRTNAGLILLTCFLLAVAGAAHAEDIYFPLAGGMEWIYDFQVISTNGLTNNGVMHRKIGEAVQHAGKTYFRSHTWLEADRPFHMDYTKRVRRDDAGYYSIDERDPQLVEKQGGRLPLEVGKKWENQVEGGVLQTTVLAREDVTFRGKVYTNCFRIRIASPGGEYLEEFVEAPGAGSLNSKAKRLDGTWILRLREFKKN